MTQTTLQPVQNIAPVEQKKRSSDPAQAEYEDGKEFLEKKELAQAALAFHNALLAFEEKADRNGVANASNQLGHVCLQRLEYEMALQHYQRAWDICEQKNDSMSLLALSNQFVSVRQGLKQYPEAIHVCLDLLESYHRNNNPEGVVTTLERMVSIYLETGDKAKAADAYRTIASIHAKYKHKNIAERFMAKAQALEETA